MATDWNAGFEPVGYEINWKVFTELPVFEGSGKEETETTVGAVLREALPHLFGERAEDSPPFRHCAIENEFGALSIGAPTRTLRLGSFSNESSFAVALIETVIEIANEIEGEDFYPVFFYYDHDMVVDDAHESFSFFVVNGDRIVLERAAFSRHSSSGFNPGVFVPLGRGNETWVGHRGIQHARARSWYHRFYRDTRTGQMMALRDDAETFHFTPDWKHQAAIVMALSQIRHKADLILYVLIATAVLIALK